MFEARHQQAYRMNEAWLMSRGSLMRLFTGVKEQERLYNVLRCFTSAAHDRIPPRTASHLKLHIVTPNGTLHVLITWPKGFHEAWKPMLSDPLLLNWSAGGIIMPDSG